MKKLLYLVVGVVSFTASAQLQNLDFEQWDDPFDSLLLYNNPTGWICSNRWFGYPDANFSERFVDPVDFEGQNENYGIRLFTFYNYMKDAAVQTAPINSRPAALTGFYKYQENFVIWGENQYVDTAQVVVVLTKWNAALSQKDTIGLGRFSAHVAVDTYTPFQADIAYFSDAQPDSITILLDPSFIGRIPGGEIQNAAEGGRSIFTVDNLSLVNENLGVGDASNEHFAMYPNPANDRINFKAATGMISIFDISGRTVAQFSLENTGSADVSHLQSGTFIVQLANEEGTHIGKFIKR